MLQFEFKSKSQQKHWKAPLLKTQCGAITKSGKRCEKMTQKIFGMCPVHCKSIMGLRIGKSSIKCAGMGLFNCKPRKKGDDIIEYIGEVLDDEKLFERYGAATAPYAAEVVENKTIDSALIRSIGSYANHKPKEDANAELVLYEDQEKIYICATKPIRVGEEIFIDYGDDYEFDKKGDVHSTK